MAEITVTCGQPEQRVRVNHLKPDTGPSATAPETETHHEFFTPLKLRFNFLADVALRDAQVLSDVTVVAHQGHVAFSDVNELKANNSLHYFI